MNPVPEQGSSHPHRQCYCRTDTDELAICIPPATQQGSPHPLDQHRSSSTLKGSAPCTLPKPQQAPQLPGHRSHCSQIKMGQ
eukprot:2232641-Rhodomonas_salina.2